MFNRVFLIFSMLCIAFSSFAEENNGKSSQGKAAGYSSRDATALSMMGWGLGLGVGIATLCALIPNNEGSSSHSH